MHAANTYDPATNQSAYDKDPAMLADYATANITDKPNGKPDWYAFVSRWRARFATQLYAALLADPMSPELKGAQFTEYQIQARKQPAPRHEQCNSSEFLLIYIH